MLDVVVTVDVDDVEDVDAAVVVVVVVGQGSGVHDPAPRSMPPSLAQAADDPRTQEKAPPGEPGNAPPGELGTQHWTSAAVVVVVVVVIVLVVELVVPAVELVVVAPAAVVEVVLDAGTVVVVAVVVDPPEHGIDPSTPVNAVMQSTKAPTVESIVTASPVVWQSVRPSSRPKPATSLPVQRARQITTDPSSGAMPFWPP